MNKTAIRNFSIRARNKLIDDIRYRAGLLGITEDGIQPALPQSAGDTEFYDIGTAEPYAISGVAVNQRRRLVEAIRQKERDSGYQTAYKYIVEEVAYTWFNRLIAIRFMEVNDYLPSHIRVLSSESGKLEPDLVTTPFEAELTFSASEEQTVLRLKQDNQVDELFRLLFIKQCNALNEILPGLFEKTTDYTELLLSVSVVDQDGVVYRLTHDIDEDDFNIEKGGQVEIIGWLYQYWNTEPKDAVFGRPSGTKIKKEEIPAATQLFTPDWIVRYMVENSLGRLWVEGHPNDNLKENWKYYLEEAEQEPVVQTQLAEIRKEYAALSLEDIKCIDPCMGSGHILCYLFDVLIQIYESQGYSRRDAAQSIVRHNLHGLDIDKRATQLAYFSVMMKARQYDRRFFSRNLQSMVYSTTGDEEGENFGSLVMVDDPGERPEDPQTVFEIADYERRLNVWSYRYLLAQKYHVVVTNPPYMGSSGMNGKLNEFMKKNYPNSKSDASTAFMERTLQLCRSDGFMAMINIPVWMFLSSYEKLRENIISNHTIVNMVHPGRGIFGSDFGTTTFVIAKQYIKNYVGAYRRLFEKQGEVESIEKREQAFLSGTGAFAAQQDNFSKIPGAPVAYWISDSCINLYKYPLISSKFTAKEGVGTRNDDVFLRFHWEVMSTIIGIGKKWILTDKAGGYRKWYLGCIYVMDWENNGYRIKNYRNADGSLRSRPQNLQYLFKSGISWGKVGSGASSFRFRDINLGFNDAAPTLFGENPYPLLAALNTNIYKSLLQIKGGTLNVTCGVIEELPLLGYTKDIFQDNITNVVSQNIKLSRTDWDSFETSWDFTRHPLVRGASTIVEAFATWDTECTARFNRLKTNEEELNRIFIDIYGPQDELTPEVEDKDVTVRRADLGRDIRGLISYAVGCMFGRYSPYKEGLVYAGGEWDYNQYENMAWLTEGKPDVMEFYKAGTQFLPVQDNIILISDEDYFADDIVNQFVEFIAAVYGQSTLEKNLKFIADALGGKGDTPQEVIRNYFLKDFFSDHYKIYQKRPIYWLFDSGKQNGFKALIYLHRYTPDTIGNVRIDYLHRMQRVYENEINRMQDMIDHSKNPREAAVSTKRKEKLQKQLKECREYDEKISHLALSRIELDLDDGVKVNYRKAQTASDGKFYEVLADSKNIMGKK